ncbi:protein transport protein Sec24A-like isoform X2 [Gigantopelta aegis]|uniref:protein transport protein Sec24A-like isoform X2 n=1 Tax=Gigantopelta aegis TaxID=1735272 RepID=UPI001B887B40|nr:protein transport protein Sec24A-like isoform X2 [Gigantopelta aegis]
MADPLSSQNYQQHQTQQVDYTQRPGLPGGQRMPYPPGGQIQPNGSPLNASPVPGQQSQPPPPMAMGMPQHFKNQPPGPNQPPGRNAPPANGMPPPGQPTSNRVGPPQPLPNPMPPASDGGRPPHPGQHPGYQSQQFVGERPSGPAPHPPVSSGPPGGQFQPQFSNPVMNGPSNFPTPSSLANQPTGQFPPNTSVNRFQGQLPPSSQQSGMPPTTGGRTDSPHGGGMMPPTGMVQTSQQTGASHVPKMTQGAPQGGMPTSSMGVNPAQAMPRMPQNPPHGGGMPPPGMGPSFQQGGMRPPQGGVPPPMGASAGPSPPQGSSFAPPRAGVPPSNMPGPPPPQGAASQMTPSGGPPKANTPTNMVPQGQTTGRPNELPVPYHGHGQYSHQVGASLKLTPGFTPNSSDPPSQKSSRAPSPVSMQSIDALEGQFTPTAQGVPGQPPGPGVPQTAASPTQQDSSQKSAGITGRRQYPQMGAYPPASGSGPPVSQPGMYGLPATAGQNPQSTAGYGTPGIQNYGVPPSQGYNQQMRPGQPYQTGPTAGPPGPTSGPPGSMSGPPGSMSGPPGSMSGPTGSMSGPPETMSGPTGPMSGPPGTMSGPAGTMPGLSGQLSGPPGPISGPTGLVSGTAGQTMSGPTGPMSGPAGPLSGPTGLMSGPTGQGSFMPQPGQQGAQQKMMQQQNSMNAMSGDFARFGVNDSQRTVNLMQEKRLIPPEGLEVVKPTLQHDFKNVNCNPEIFRCTLRCIPQTASLLSKSRLPLGILIHPFKDLSQLPVIQSSVIVRCRSCRTYINPFVNFLDQRRWKCNLCYRVNELPEEFSFDPVSKTYGDPQRRPEVRSSTIEFIAPSEYMLRPPQPAVYLFLLDVSFNAVETGYLSLFCQTLLDELDKLPGDSRTQIGFVGYDRFLYFFSLAEGLAQPQMMIVPDLEDIFLPCPDNLLVNLHESKDLVIDLLSQLPGLFEGNGETGSALGAALQAAYKMMSSTGGRVTVMQTVLPTVGPGALQMREMPAQDVGKNIPHLGPATDFYKKMALDFSAQQIAVDLFMLNGQYADIASLACISKYSAGCIQYYPSFHTLKNPSLADKFDMDLRRYFTRKIGFEAVMRIRCTRGLSIHTFHGNFFVRSTDLLSLPNINPDAGFGMQMSVEDSLTDMSTVCFQAALLYTSSKGERRIRVHTLCLPVTNQISDLFGGADQQAIISLLAKMAVDRSVSSSVGDAKDAMINAALDATQSYSSHIAPSQHMGALLYPFTLRCLPVFILSLIKSNAFRLSSTIKLDDRVFLMQQFKSLPCNYLIQLIYPDLYPIHNLDKEVMESKNGITIPKPPVLQLNSANIDRHGVYLMDSGEQMLMLVGGAVSDHFCQQVFDKPNFMSIPDGMTDLPELENLTSENVRNFVNNLTDNAPSGSTFLVIREDSKMRYLFFEHMTEDRSESSMSYYEFLQYLQQRSKS